MKNRLFKIVAVMLCALFCVSAIPGFTFAQSGLLLNQSFNQYATNDIPLDGTFTGSASYIKEYAPGEKGVFISTWRSSSSLEYTFDEVSDVCVSFDIMSASGDIAGNVAVSDKTNTALNIFRFDRMHKVSSYDNLGITGYNDKNMANLAFCIDSENQTADIYANGKLIVNDKRILSKLPGKVNKLTFTFSQSDNADSGVIIDNINVHSAKAPEKKYPESEYNPEVLSPVVIKTEAVAEGGRIQNIDFETSLPFTLAVRGNTLEQYKEENGNTAVLFERFTESDFHMDLRGVSSVSDYVVYEFDMNIIDGAKTDFTVNMKDANAKYSSICKITKGGILNVGSVSKSVSPGTWHRVSAVYNYFDRTRSYWLDGKKIASDLPIETAFASGDKLDVFRVYCSNSTSPEADHAKFMIDNVRIYESKEPVEDIDTLSRTVIINRDRSVFPGEAKYMNLLKGYTAVHTRSGMVISDGEKSILPTLPMGTGEESMAVLGEICEILGVSYSENSDGAYVNQKRLNEVAVSNHEGKTYVNLNYLFSDILNKKITIDESAKSNGLMIAGDKKFDLPSSEEELKELNNFCFFYRPAEEVIKESYASSGLSGVHPRIQATKSDFEKIKEKVKTDSYMKFWYDEVMTQADGLLLSADKPLLYELRDGVRLLYVSRDMLQNMYTLGFAYQLTGDEKYVQRAWVDLKAVSEFPDWHPVHDIDLGEMAAAVSIGYDWMYEALTPEQRSIIEKGIYQNGIYDLNLAYQSRYSRIGGGIIATHNHNAVITGGAVMTALAFMDVYPEECAYICSNALRALEYNIINYGPDGVWYEGAGYWQYETQYISKMLSSLEKVFDHTFGMELVQGLSTTIDYMFSVQSDVGVFPYGDSSTGVMYVPEMLYFSKLYNRPDYTSTYISARGGRMGTGDFEDRVQGMLWYNTEAGESDSQMPLDSFYESEGVATMRNEWSSSGMSFAGIHGGKTNVTHSHLDGGTFIYDYAGVRWANAHGGAPYDIEGNADYSENGARWRMFLTRAEAHNTLVINPDENCDQKVNSEAPLVRFESKDKGAIAVMDLSDNYSDDASKVKRGLFLTDDRISLVIRDEITLYKESEVYWFMQTDTDVQINGNKAVLTKDGKKMNLEFVSSVPGTLECGPMVPLPTSPVIEGDTTHPDESRIAIKLTAKGDVTITVKLTPEGIVASDINDYDKAIDSWKVEDGERTVRPKLESAKSNGKNIEFDNSNYAILEYYREDTKSVPITELTYNTGLYDAEIKNAASLSDVTQIKIIEKANPLNYSTYFISYVEVPKPVDFNSKITHTPVSVRVSAEPQSENPATALYDKNLSTRWSADGSGQWVIYEFAEEVTVDHVIIAFFSGAARQTKIDINLSTDGVNYESIFDGYSSGKTADYEQFPAEGKKAKYVKIICYGNTVQGSAGWNSLSEVAVTQNK